MLRISCKVSKYSGGVRVLPTQTGGRWLQVRLLHTTLAVPYSRKRFTHRNLATLPRCRTRTRPLRGSVGFAHWPRDVTSLLASPAALGGRSRWFILPATHPDRISVCSGVASNLQMPAPDEFFLMCPPLFSCASTWGGTTVVCYRLRDN